ncbi:hypothetical protein L596_029973 [Steinernema carpocapsae]|uniref:Aminopeptidase N-like N-terminal domain-containing protein n=1 Tax=Steinernema carpocapsae TaxID=34508 RepID=A0A4U5LRC9_STECR|nr:hypothetical protein L596_029973 [Steinernema carpocapsae]
MIDLNVSMTMMEYNGIVVIECQAYYGNYTNLISNKNQFYLAAVFEQNFARSMLPCFDEPAMKATFKTRISVDREFDVFSNSKEVQNSTDV